MRRLHRLVALVAGLAALACSASAAGAAATPVLLERGVVAAPESLASEAGAAILRARGNAVDAAIAVHFALAVTYPRAGNLGGATRAALEALGYTLNVRRSPLGDVQAVEIAGGRATGASDPRGIGRVTVE